MNFQGIIKQAQAEGVDLLLVLDPYAEYETDQFTYFPSNALSLYPNCIILGHVFADGEVVLRNNA